MEAVSVAVSRPTAARLADPTVVRWGVYEAVALGLAGYARAAFRVRAVGERHPLEPGTLIVSSHHLSEIEKVATHVGLIHRGRLLVEDSLARLLGHGTAVELATDDLASTETLLINAGFSAVTGDGRILVEAPSPAEIAALVVGSGQRLHHLSVRRPSLEQTYHQAIAA